MNPRTCIALVAGVVGALSVACSATPDVELSSSDSAPMATASTRTAPRPPTGPQLASSAGDLTAYFTIRSANDFDISVTRAGRPYVTVNHNQVERMYGFTAAELATPEGRKAAAVEAGRKDAAGVPAMTRVNETFLGVARQIGVTTPLGSDLIRFIAKTSPIRSPDDVGGGVSAQDGNTNCHLITSGVSLAGGIACTIFTVGIGAVLCFGGTIAFDVVSHYGCEHFFPPNQGGSAIGPSDSMTPTQVCKALDDMNQQVEGDINDLRDLVHACEADGLGSTPPPAP